MLARHLPVRSHQSPNPRDTLCLTTVLDRSHVAEPIDRGALAADLDRVRIDFHQLLGLVEDDEWTKATAGTRWTNEQLLFHMVFGYMVVRRLLVLVRLFGLIPDRVSKTFARILDASTPPFHLINFYGSCGASLVYNRRRIGGKMNRVIDKLQRSLAGERDDAFERGMHYPVRWDPYFREYMTLADIYRYPGQHYDHHRRQLTIAKLNRSV